MPKKVYTKSGKSCRVTFELPAELDAKEVFVCGDFNDWDQKSHPMRKRSDGTFYKVIYLDAGKSYKYRFFKSDGTWENDWEAEQYEPSEFGWDNCIVTV